MMRVLELTIQKFVAGSLVLLTVFSLISCKQTTAEKNTVLVKETMPVIVAQKDSLSAELQTTQQAFQAFKNKTVAASSILEQPEYSKLSKEVDGIVMKSERLNELVPSIESKLKELENLNPASTTEAVQHEIEVLQQLLQNQRGRMINYQQTYQKLEHRLDSIQNLIKK